jgi:hypothetical protein
MAGQELAHRRGLVRREVVGDQVQRPVGGDGSIQLGQEGDEVGRTARVAEPRDDLTVVDVQRGEQHRGAVAAVPELLRALGARSGHAARRWAWRRPTT